MSPPDPNGRDSLRARLRAATGPAHRALEDSLDWRARVATLAGYRDLLARLHGFHAAWEPAIGMELADEPFLGPRRRLALLAADLGHLGLSPTGIGALPGPGPVRLPGAGAAMGALYVLEGSTLGGQVIGRHITSLHGFSGDGLGYYRAHGPRTGAMWSIFLERLERFSDDHTAVTAGAVATFAALRVWLCGPQPGEAAGSITMPERETRLSETIMRKQ
ncbi:biliverdin-producing heme oxygenase [Methylobacterium sp. NEAU K]|uniref:biliverdin-producing heme oxygenase n=1 Tax=Methylobacterium sp. NEAU K TaxID=3064946 RepID=UPI002734AE4D|nr:biliverdin-producing heme oxygenase [Methylobacterium sp. NEAU K]MDP4001870.1 biliverdin-producing heme oxygenase [Methylobacterium sp. NEAU K]